MMARLRSDLLVVFGVVLSASAFVLIFDLGEMTAALSDLTLPLLVLAGGLSWLSLRLVRSEGAQRALNESQEQMRLFALATNDQLWNWDHSTGEVTRNTAFETAFGYAAEEIQSDIAWWSDRLHPEDRDRVIATYQATVERGDTSCSYEYRFRCRGGSYATISDRAYIIRDHNGRRIRTLGAMTDITDRRRLEKQLRQTQKMEVVGQLAGGIAHDFNNQLMAMMINTESVQEDLAKDTSDQAIRTAIAGLDNVLLACHRAASLTRRLLAFSRKQITQPESFDVALVIDDTKKTWARLIGEHIEIETVRSNCGAAWIHADRSQFEQIIINLVINAADAMPRGGRLTIGVAHATLDEAYVTAHADACTGPHVVLTVRDTGVGISAETMSHLFEPFFTTKPIGKGTGLGLATVYGLVRQMRGHITVESEVGEGSTFTVHLPASEAPAQESAPVTKVEAETGQEVILLCEDNSELRGGLATMLRNVGHEVLVAATGKEALDVAAERSGPIHLLLTDVVMPGMNGLELAKELVERRPEIRVLLMSGYTSQILQTQGVEDSAFEVIEKPVLRRPLVERIRKVLDVERQSAPQEGR